MEKLIQKSPMYAQLRDILEDRIISQKLKAGANLPSERELCEEFNVSKHTVIKALTDLVAKGLVRREQGKGTFVSGFTPKVGTIRFLFYRTAEELPLDNYYASVLGAVESVVSGNSYDLVVCSTRTNGPNILLGPDDVGYLIVGPVLDELAKYVVSRGAPVVSIDHMDCPAGAGVVAFDEIASGELAGEYLLSKGFKKIGYIGGYDPMSEDKREWPNSVLRLKGVRKALAKKGLEMDEAHIIRVCRGAEYPAALKKMIEHGLPDAFAVFSESNGEALVNALEKLGHPMGADRLVSFAPLNFSPTLPGMARVAGDPGKLGLDAAKMLMAAIKEPRKGGLRKVLLQRRLYQQSAAPVRE